MHILSRKKWRNDFRTTAFLFIYVEQCFKTSSTDSSIDPIRYYKRSGGIKELVLLMLFVSTFKKNCAQNETSWSALFV